MRGRVLSIDNSDTIPVTSQWVLLHQITSSGGRVLDSARTDGNGAYALRAAARDTGSVYISSLSYRGVGYFSTPVHASGPMSDTVATLFVFDTSSVRPQIDLVQRHVVVRAPDPDGSRTVLELIVLQNRGSVTRVAQDTAHPVWQVAIPSAAFNLEVAPSDVSSDAVYARGDSVAVAAAMPPGAANQKQLVFGYSLPPNMRTLRIPIDQTAERFQVLIEDSGVEMLSGPLQALGTESMEDVEFTRFEGKDVESGEVVFRLSGPPVSLTVLLWAIVAVAGTAMLVVMAMWLRRPVSLAAQPASIDALAAQVAALDRQFAGTAAQATAAEREEYQRLRSEMKARLTSALTETGK